MNITLHKSGKPVSGSIHLPGSKSISNRVLMIKALSGLNFPIINLSDSDDTKHLQKALELIDTDTSGIIDIGHAGTDMRFLTAYLSLKQGTYELTGSERLQQRPVKELADVLKNLGADIIYKNKNGYPPLIISGKQLKGGKALIQGHVSSQFISALLLTAPYFEAGLELSIENEIVSKPYIHMTIEIMKEFGAKVLWENNKIKVYSGSYSYTKQEYIVESDWSAASYFYSFVALSGIKTELTLQGLFETSLQADAACVEIYKSFGIETIFGSGKIIITKKADTSVSKFEYNFINCPDIAQTVACTCAVLNRSFYFTGLQTLKVKETDRILALKNELKKFGIDIQATSNTIRYDQIKSKPFFDPVSVSTYNDHRMAMSFAPLTLLVNTLIIEDAGVVSKSYPEFWNDLNKIGITHQKK